MTCVPGAGTITLPALTAGRVSPALLPQLGGCHVSYRRSLGTGEERKALCKLTLHNNCPEREDRRVTTWFLHIHVVCLSFPPALHVPPLLLPSAALSGGLSCSSFSVYPDPHQTYILSSSYVIQTCLCLCFFKLCKGNSLRHLNSGESQSRDPPQHRKHISDTSFLPRDGLTATGRASGMLQVPFQTTSPVWTSPSTPWSCPITGLS